LLFLLVYFPFVLLFDFIFILAFKCHVSDIGFFSLYKFYFLFFIFVKSWSFVLVHVSSKHWS